MLRKASGSPVQTEAIPSTVQAARLETCAVIVFFCRFPFRAAWRLLGSGVLLFTFLRGACSRVVHYGRVLP